MLLRVFNIFKSSIQVNMFMRKNKITFDNVGVLYGMREYQIEDFLVFLAETKFAELINIEVLKNKKILLFQSDKALINIINNRLIILTPDPIICLVLKNDVLRNRLLMRSFFDLIFYHLKKDYYSKYLLNKLNSISKLDILTTISTLGNHPKIFYVPSNRREYLTHVVHYAQNTTKIQTIDEEDSEENHAWITQDISDVHWVWTRNYAEYLGQLTDKITFKSVGSIIFQRPLVNLIKNQRKTILVFPTSTPKGWDHGGPKKFLNNDFYNIDVTIKFLEDIINVRDEELGEYDVLFKPKRVISNQTISPHYVDFIRELEQKNKITVLDWRVNLYEITHLSHFNISYPFTSTAIIAREMGRNSIFYYPVQKILKNPFYEDHIPVIYGANSLSDYLTRNSY